MEAEIREGKLAHKARKLGQGSFSIARPYQSIVFISVQEVFSMKRHILDAGDGQPSLICNDGFIEVCVMLMQHDGDEVEAFRKILIARFINVQVQSVCLKIQKWRGTNLAALTPAGS